MALLYPWATKEYLLWEMTIGQIIMYHNKGNAIKNGTYRDNIPESSVEDLKRIRDSMADKYGDIE